MDDIEEALREALLNMLLDQGIEMMRDEIGRATMSALYEARARTSHPAVASVLRQASCLLSSDG